MEARIGRYQEKPSIGWSRKEIIWLEAALTLPAIDFFLACDDIASMSGRTVAAVTQQAKKIQREAAKSVPLKVGGQLPPFRQPDKKQLMGGHARRAVSSAA